MKKAQDSQKDKQFKKTSYYPRDWSKYDKALVQRGSLTIWISDEVIAQWRHDGQKRRGRPSVYSDIAIEAVPIIKEVFHLTNRSAEGFVRSLFEKLGIPLPVPDHNTLSRRGRKLNVRLPKKAKGPLNLVIDSTGLKLYDYDEWNSLVHGASKKHTWIKIHLAVDSESGEIQAVEITEADVHDYKVVRKMLEKVEQRVASVSAPRSYDTKSLYNAIQGHSSDARINIPPRKGARIWKHKNVKRQPHNMTYLEMRDGHAVTQVGWGSVTCGGCFGSICDLCTKSADLLSFYEQLLVYEEHKHDIEKPLWIFVGTTVASRQEKSDVIQIVELIRKAIPDENRIKRLYGYSEDA